MKRLVLSIIYLTIIVIVPSCHNSDKWTKLDMKQSLDYYHYLIDSNKYNPINQKPKLIHSEELAIKIAEIYLFDIYGKNEIIKQKPYQICLVNNYWIIVGSYLSIKATGGVFEIAIDSRNGQIVGIIKGE